MIGETTEVWNSSNEKQLHMVKDIPELHQLLIARSSESAVELFNSI